MTARRAGTQRAALPVAETAAVAVLGSGSLAYTLRRSPRARRMRVTVDPRHGVVVTVPGGRTARRDVAAPVEAFLREREAWLRRHLDRHAVQRARLAARGPLGPGSTVPYRGEPHALRVEAPFGAAPGRGSRRSAVTRVGGDVGDELVIRLGRNDSRALADVLEAWFRDRARVIIARELAAQAPRLGVAPTGFAIRDPRTRWGSAARSGRLSFSWRLVLAPPEALETVVVHELAHLRVFGHSPAFWAVVAEHRPDHARWRRWLRDHALELHEALDPA